MADKEPAARAQAQTGRPRKSRQYRKSRGNAPGRAARAAPGPAALAAVPRCGREQEKADIANARLHSDRTGETRWNHF